jgi:hypothetical protein
MKKAITIWQLSLFIPHQKNYILNVIETSKMLIIFQRQWLSQGPSKEHHYQDFFSQ